MKSIFSRHGIPEVLLTKNGPQYDSRDFTEFASHFGFSHTSSSPHFPQSNGYAERAVKTVKGCLKKSKDPYLALFSYRATPLPWWNLSPAELLMGRHIGVGTGGPGGHVPHRFYSPGARGGHLLCSLRAAYDWGKQLTHSLYPRELNNLFIYSVFVTSRFTVHTGTYVYLDHLKWVRWQVNGNNGEVWAEVHHVTCNFR